MTSIASSTRRLKVNYKSFDEFRVAKVNGGKGRGPNRIELS